MELNNIKLARARIRREVDAASAAHVAGACNTRRASEGVATIRTADVVFGGELLDDVEPNEYGDLQKAAHLGRLPLWSHGWNPATLVVHDNYWGTTVMVHHLENGTFLLEVAAPKGPYRHEVAHLLEGETLPELAQLVETAGDDSAMCQAVVERFAETGIFLDEEEAANLARNATSELEPAESAGPPDFGSADIFRRF